MCPLLKTTHSYAATVNGFCNSYVVNYKRYSFVSTEVTILIQWLKSQMLQYCAIYLKNIWYKYSVYYTYVYS